MPTSPSHSQLKCESIAFWCVASVLFIGRLWSRAIFKKGITKIQLDDYIMIATFCCYTALLLLIQGSGYYGTNEMDRSMFASVLADPVEVSRRVYGSKLVVGSNQMYLLTLWGVKACLLALYYSMTRLTSHNTIVKIAIVYVALGFIATELPLFINCRPFSQYWALPVYDRECSTYHTYTIIQTVFNVSSDLFLLIIPMFPVLVAKTPRSTKAILVGIFSLGIFVILASILNKYYNFIMPNTTVYMIWHIREASTSVMVANLMCWWPLLRKIFGFRHEFLNRSSSSRNRTHASSASRPCTERPSDLDWVELSSSDSNPKVETKISSNGSFSEKHVDLEKLEYGPSEIANRYAGQVSGMDGVEVIHGVAVHFQPEKNKPRSLRGGLTRSFVVSQTTEKSDSYLHY
ncbi:hypothetical protein EJ08DRAFT_738253 [Tothia fuscella]|uniref:Rhodopsin domain-containing protein n=1 Tax=Tothia fuscella TaxID=1048955 RepID=A0A9P4NHH4_9PEZI|nr:hypothetical protein EJ08DRAFT_738253 [Tothia fuscella]